MKLQMAKEVPTMTPHQLNTMLCQEKTKEMHTKEMNTMTKEMHTKEMYSKHTMEN
jgi:hypothetical protein